MPFLCRFREKRIKKQGFTHIFNNTLLYHITQKRGRPFTSSFSITSALFSYNK
nr:MAG TPA: hypothetical protein [Caudoviricetes sp.]